MLLESGAIEMRGEGWKEFSMRLLFRLRMGGKLQVPF